MSLGKYFRLIKTCKAQAMCQFHVANFRSVGAAAAVNKYSRVDKLMPHVKMRNHKILEENQGYQETVFVPENLLGSYRTTAHAGKHLQLSADVPTILPVLCKTTDISTDEMLKLHFSRTIASISCFDKHVLNLCLYELDALFMKNVDIIAPVQAFLSLVDMHWFNLVENNIIESRHVIHILFFVGAIRDAPTSLFQHLEDYLTIHVDHLPIKEWSLVCSSFFASNRRIGSIDLLRKIAEALLKEHQKCPVNLLGNFMKVLHHAVYNPSGFYMQLGDTLAERSDLSQLFSLTGAAHILSLYASVRIVHERLFKVLKQGINYALKNYNARLRLTKDLCRICWAFTTLQEPVPQQFLVTLKDELTYTIKRHLWKFPETTIEILRTLAVNGIYPRDILVQVFSSAFLKFKQERLLAQDSTLQLLETSARLNLANLRMKRLSNEVQKRVQESQPDIKFQVVKRIGLQPLVMGLLECLPSPQCLALHYILPHSQILDIELRFNAQGKPIEIPDGIQNDAIMKSLNAIGRRSGDSLTILHKLGLQHNTHCGPLSNLYCKANEHVNKIRKNDIRLVIKVYSWNQYTRNPTRLLGLHMHEVNLLKQLGYHVIGINPADASHLGDMTEDELASYIDRFILKKIRQYV